jgi:hypothetical protein
MRMIDIVDRRTARLMGGWAFAVAVRVAAVGPAEAQVAAPLPVPDLTRPATLPELQPVGTRSNPEYDPQPILYRSFDITPSIEVGERFDSNIFGSSVHPLPDFITVARPAVSVVSDWGGGDAVAFYGAGDVEQFARHTSDNVGNVTLEADDRYDIVTGEYLELRTGYQIQHENRFAADSEQAVELAGGGAFARFPTEFDVALGTLSFVRSLGLFGLAVDAGAQAYAFSNEPTLNGGLAINSDRNRDVYTVTPRLSYELEPDVQAFVQISGSRTQYDTVVDTTPDHFKRSSYSYAAAAGSQFDIADAVTGEFYLGYLGNQYDDARLQSINGPYFGGNFLWNVTPRTSLTLDSSRTIAETILIGSPGAFLDQVDVGIQQEVLTNVLATGNASYLATEYQGIGRTDDVYSLSTGAKWQLNRYFGFTVNGSWQRRISNLPGNGLVDETVSIGLKSTL